QNFVESLRKPPRRFAEERHYRENQRHSYQGSVNEDAGGRIEAYHLNGRVVMANKARKDGNHDQCCISYHTRPMAETCLDSLPGNTRFGVFLMYARNEEEMKIHRQWVGGDDRGVGPNGNARPTTWSWGVSARKSARSG